MRSTANERELAAAFPEGHVAGLANHGRRDTYPVCRNIFREYVPVGLGKGYDPVERGYLGEFLVLLPFVEDPVVPCDILEERHLVGDTHELYLVLHEDSLHIRGEQHPEGEVRVEFHLDAVEPFPLAQVVHILHESVGEFRHVRIEDRCKLEQVVPLRHADYVASRPALHLPSGRGVDIRQDAQIGVDGREGSADPCDIRAREYLHPAIPCLLKFPCLAAVSGPCRIQYGDVVDVLKIIHHGEKRLVPAGIERVGDERYYNQNFHRWNLIFILAAFNAENLPRAEHISSSPCREHFPSRDTVSIHLT